MGEGIAAAGVAIGTWLAELSAVEALYLVAAAASVGYSAYQMTEANSLGGATERVDGSSHLMNNKSSNAPLPLIYGECRVGGNIVYATTSWEANYYLHMIVALGEGPIQAIDEVYLNGRPYTSYPSLYVHVETFTGTATQNVSSNLRAHVPGWTDPLRNTAYVYVRLFWDDEGQLWQGIPVITAKVRGLQVMDPATETVAYSNNPALAAYDMLTRPSYRGGLGLDTWCGSVPASPRIDVDMVDDAAGYCTTKGWTCNMPVTLDQYFIDNLALVLPLFRGDLVYSETVFKMIFKDLNYESVAASFDEDDVLRAGNISTLTVRQPDIWDRPNTVRVKYLDETGDPNGWGSYQTVDYIKTDAAALAADGDSREREINLYGFSSLDLVQPMANYILERARNGKTAGFTLGRRAAVLEPGDIIQLTHAFPGWSAKVLRVLSASLVPDSLAVAVEAIEEADSLYDDDYDPSDPAFYDTDLPGPDDAVPSVRNVVLSEENYYYRDKRYTRLLVDFSPPDAALYPFFKWAEVYVSIGDNTHYRYIAHSGGDYQLDPVEIGETYFIKLRVVSRWGTKEDQADAPEYSRTIQGYTSAPSDMTSITPAVVNDAVYVSGTEVADAGIRGYEFRISGQDNTAWAGATYLAFNRKPVWQMSGMRAGDFRIWCSPQDDQGQYSGTPVYADFTVGVPHGYTLSFTEDIDYDDAGDSHSNTEFYDEGGGEYALRCSHSSGLSGTYTGREIDLGSIQSVRVQGDFLSKVINSSITWAALVGTTDTWADLDVDRSWADIFGIDNPSQITAKLKWGTVSGSLTNSQELFERMAVSATGRYFQVEITITDPHEAQFGMLPGPDADTVLQLKFYT